MATTLAQGHTLRSDLRVHLTRNPGLATVKHSRPEVLEPLGSP